MTLRSWMTAALLGCIGFLVGLPMGALTSLSSRMQATGREMESSSALKPASPQPALVETAAASGRPVLSLLLDPAIPVDQKADLFLQAKDLNADACRQFATFLATHAQSGRRSFRLEGSVFGRWSSLDPEGAWSFARESLKGKTCQIEAMLGCLTQVAKKDISKALRMAETAQRPEMHGKLWSAMKKTLGPSDQLRALAQFPDDVASEEEVSTLAWSIANRHPATLRAALKDLPLRMRGPATEALCRVAGEFDPDAALNLALELPPGEWSAKAISRSLAMLWGRHPERALALIVELPPERLEPAALAHAIDVGLAPVAEVAKVAGRLPPEARGVFLTGVFAGAGSASTDRFLDLAEAIPIRPDDKGRWLELAANSLSRSEPESASQWIANTPPSSAKDAMLKGMSDELFYRNPQAALSRSLEISNSDVRGRTMAVYLRRWLLENRGAATAWLRDGAQNVLDAATRQSWLRRAGASADVR